jgi:flavin-dependent dehydrogenase
MKSFTLAIGTTLLIFAHTSPASAETVTESARNIPIVNNVDIVVVGGSSAGAAAAIEAAQAGAKVLLVGQRSYLGDDLCGTYRLWLDPNNEEPNSPLAQALFAEPVYPGIPFTYETSRGPDYQHPDTNPPSHLTDGLFSSAATQSVQYNGNVVIYADMGELHSIRKVHVFVYQRQSDFEVNDVTVYISEDEQDWEQMANIINEAPSTTTAEFSAIDLSATINRQARYVKFDVHKRWPAWRVLLGEIVIKDENQPLPPPWPMQVKRTLDNALIDANVQFLFSSYPTDVLHDSNGNPAGIVIANRSGRQAVLAKVIIDATPRATVARIAGAAFQPFPAGPQTFKRIVIGGDIHTGDNIQAQIMPAPMSYQNNNYQAIEYTLTIPMEDGSFASFADAEQYARDLTWDGNQVDSSETMFQVPPDPVIGISSIPDPWPGVENAEPDAFRPVDVNRLYVLSGCADMSRQTAETLLYPLVLMDMGTRIGRIAAEEANLLPPPTDVQLTGNDGQGTVEGDVRETLQGIRPIESCLPAAPNEMHTLPVLGQYDVVVVGGGTSGAPAGIAAAREGKSTLVIEYLYGLGGVGTMGLIGSYASLPKGFTNEIDNGVTNMGGRVVIGSTKYWKPEHKMEWYRRELRQAGADIWFGVLGCGAFVNNGCVKGVVVVTPEGRGVVLAKVVIDSTGSSDIAISAGAQYMLTNPDIALQGSGLPAKGLGDYYNNTDYTFIDDSDMKDIWFAFVSGRERYNNSYDMGQLTDRRERRRIIGDFVVSPLDIYNSRTYPDSIVLISSVAFDSHGYTTQPLCMFKKREELRITTQGPYPYIPYRSLLPKDIEGILVTGQGISADRDAMSVLRMQPDSQNQGYAAGLAASLAADANISPRYIDVKVLQNKLVQKGCLPSTVLTDVDSFPLSQQRIAQAVNDVVYNFNGIEAILAQPEDALPLLRNAYENAEPEDKLTYAEILGVMGDATGSATLIDAVQSQWWDTGWNFQPSGGSIDNSLSPVDVLIVALGRTRDPQGLEPILDKLEHLSSSSYFSHHRAVAMALEALGERAAAEPLAELLQKPGMSGYAYTDINDSPPYDPGSSYEERGLTMRELILARALYECGDYNGLGESILMQYDKDFHSHYARHANALLRSSYPDLNSDCIIDFGDLTPMADEWLMDGNDITADLDKNGRVDFNDFAIIAHRWLTPGDFLN